MAFCPKCGAQIADGATCERCAGGGQANVPVAQVATGGGLEDNVAGALAYQAETVKDGGTIVGTVRFDGAPPARKPVEISKVRDVA